MTTEPIGWMVVVCHDGMWEPYWDFEILTRAEADERLSQATSTWERIGGSMPAMRIVALIPDEEAPDGR